MTPESIFSAALELEPAARAAYLDEVCAHDTALRARIEKMLAAQPDLGRFLTQLLPGPAGDPHRASGLRPPDVPVGAILAGKYKLLQQIGKGGMGTVWMADQLAPVRRRVAVKLISNEHGRSGEVLARFDAERQAIALMDHPHIAKLLDAGTTGEAEPIGPGRPYFVMELVKGVPLNEFCDQNQLPIPARLRLFVQVCSAVQHAHQKGVIHRDLKPGNILVESHDGKPVPRVIDFGLAKAIGGVQLTDRTLFTQLGTVAGTPLYMAPEQATFNALDIDTRADVYALGVILYELLTGTTPIEREQLKKSPFDEILRAIRESEPPTPSKRLSSTGSKPAVAANRQTEPQKLGRFVRGELDWIVMKALAKERDRRYESANVFAGDVERFLEHEPVLAGPPGTAYRVRKFARRYRSQVVAGCVLVTLLLAGTAGTTFGLIRAEYRRRDAEWARVNEAEQRKDAERARADEAEQRKKAEKARDRTWQALDAMTTAATGDSLATQKAISAEQKKFLAEVLAHYRELAAEQADDEPSRARTAAAALRVGLIEYRLGRIAEAVVACRLARDAYVRLVADFPADPLHRRHLGRSHTNLGLVAYHLGKRDEAADQYRKGLAVTEQLVAESPTRPEYRDDQATLHLNLGVLLSNLGERRAAADQYHKARTLCERLSAEHPEVPAYLHGRGTIHTNLAILLFEDDKPKDAAEQFRAALAVHKKLADDHPTVREYREELGACHNNLGTLLNDLEQHRKALVVREKLVSDFPGVPTYNHNLATTCYNFGNALWSREQHGKAEELLRKALAVLEPLVADERAVPEYRLTLASSHNSLGNVLRDLPGRREEAEENYRTALAIREKLAADFPREPRHRRLLADTHNNLAVTLCDGDQREKAEEQYHKALTIREQVATEFPDTPKYRIELGVEYSNFARFFRDTDRPERSLVWCEKAIATLTAVPEQNRASARPHLARVYERRASAHALLRQFVEANEDWDRALKLTPAAGQPAIRAKRASARLNAGLIAEAMEEVAELTKSSNWKSGQWYDFAGLCAVASDRSADNKQKHADRAMELLRKAVSAGFKDAARMAKDETLAALRERADFKRLLAMMTKEKP